MYYELLNLGETNNGECYRQQLIQYKRVIAKNDRNSRLGTRQ